MGHVPRAVDVEGTEGEWYDEEGRFQILPECWATFQLFRDLADQWEVVSGFSSLYYCGIPLERISLRVKQKRMAEQDEDRAIDDLLDMASEAKQQLNKRIAEQASTAPKRIGRR